MPDAHSNTIPASAAARNLECLASCLYEKEFQNIETSYAKEGTLAHSLAELTAKRALGQLIEQAYQELRAELLATEDGQTFFNQEMQEHADCYAEHIAKKLDVIKENCEDAFVELEVKSDFSEWIPDGWGTSDCVIVADDLLEIIDLKYGKGTPVSAENNTQLRLYALGAYTRYKALYDFKYVRMTIFQPRLRNVCSDTVTLDELLAWAEQYVKPRALIALNGAGEFSPSENACRFCKAKQVCKARYEQNLALFNANKDARSITVDEAAAVLEKSGDFKKWLDDLESLVSAELLAGGKVSGWKLVEGKSNRKISDLTKAVELLTLAGIDKALLYKSPEVITLTEMEKSFGKKFVAATLEKLITKPAGKPTLAKASDARAEYNTAAAIVKAFEE